MSKVKIIKQGGRKKKEDFDVEPEESDTPKQIRKLQIADNRNELKSIQQKIAGHPMCHKHWMFRGGTNIYRDDISMRVVDWYFPYATGGALYIDEVRENESTEKYELKALAFKEFKIGRYCFIKPSTTKEQALDQMGEI